MQSIVELTFWFGILVLSIMGFASFIGAIAWWRRLNRESKQVPDPLKRALADLAHLGRLEDLFDATAGGAIRRRWCQRIAIWNTTLAQAVEPLTEPANGKHRLEISRLATYEQLQKHSLVSPFVTRITPWLGLVLTFVGITISLQVLVKDMTDMPGLMRGVNTALVSTIAALTVAMFSATALFLANAARKREWVRLDRALLMIDARLPEQVATSQRKKPAKPIDRNQTNAAKL